MRPADEGRRHAGLTDRRLEPCPRHMRPVASAAWEAMVRDPGTAVQTVDLATYRALLADPTWGLVRQLLVTTRWYDKGMELALAWLAVTDRYEAVLPAPEVATGRAQLYGLLLDMLDRLDAWETYLEVWSQLRRHTAYSLAYGDGPHSAATRPQAQPYVVRREPGEIQLHFLWLSSYRKDLIDRRRETCHLTSVDLKTSSPFSKSIFFRWINSGCLSVILFRISAVRSKTSSFSENSPSNNLSNCSGLFPTNVMTSLEFPKSVLVPEVSLTNKSFILFDRQCKYMV